MKGLFNCIERGLISKITCDSREVVEGSLFFAISGVNVNGEEFVEEAIDKGAKYIVVSDTYAAIKSSIKEDIGLFYSNSIREDFALASSLFYRHYPKNTAAVTGTNGKTSTSYFYSQMIAFIVGKSGLIGTNGALIFSKESEADRIIKERLYRGSEKIEPVKNLTTPQADVLHEYLAKMSEQGVKYAMIEASSHSASQKRIAGVKFSVAGFTNITPEHLDYHKTMEKYFDAKLSILKADSVAVVVINGDIPEYEAIAKACLSCNKRVISYGMKKENDISFDYRDGQLLFNVFGRRHSVQMRIMPRFQHYNIACALGMALISLGEASVPDLLNIISFLTEPEGRMENVGGRVYVDYAHTQDSLRSAMLCLKEIYQGKLIVIFGCGGDRYKEKRQEMGKCASEIADFVIITDDNPRFESPDKIREEIISGVVNNDYIEIGDRKKAIEYAITTMSESDILLIAGRGSESCQDYGTKVIPLSDAKCAKEVLAMIGKM